MEPAKESIFISALRTFVKAFAVILGIFIAFVPMTLLMSSLGSSANPLDKTTMQILPDLEGKTGIVSPTAPAILQLNIQGVIGINDGSGVTAEDIKIQLIESRKNLLKNNRIKAILLNINTPGGTVIDSDTIYHLLKEYKAKYQVPIYAYVDGLCASGGMYISAAADQIYSSSASIIGSIGVRMGPFFNVVETLQKLGVNALTLTEGKDKDMMNPFREWKPDEAKALNAIGSYFYETFVDLIVSNRPRVDRKKLIDVYGANVFDPETAQKIGYIDNGKSTYNETLKALMNQAKINPDEPYQVIELQMKKKWLQNLFKGNSPIFTGKIKHEVSIGNPALQEAFSYIYEPGNVKQIYIK